MSENAHSLKSIQNVSTRKQFTEELLIYEFINYDKDLIKIDKKHS